MRDFFTRAIVDWAPQGARDLPWKKSPDPYRIWLSEIILQQTRVDQGMPYYHKFTRQFPDVHSLASASEDEVLKCWQGLGYYSRARNLHHTAQYISGMLDGQFPDTYEQLLELKGVGPYTAAAIASFAFGLPYAVVDGNVERVLARYFGLKEAVNTTAGKKDINRLAASLLYSADAATYNQAIMDLGSLVCSPRRPVCDACPLSSHCRAYATGNTLTWPVKKAKAARRERFLTYLVLEKDQKIWLNRRSGKDIWKGLYEFPLIEEKGKTPWSELLQSPTAKKLLPAGFKIVEYGNWVKQDLSHQRIHARFLKASLQGADVSLIKGYLPVDREFIHTFAFPRIIARYLVEIT